MLLYGLALTPLAADLRTAFPRLVQPWYADNNAAMGEAEDLCGYLHMLQKLGPH